MTVYSSGIIYDNLEEYSKAIDNYKKFANVCQKMNEPQLEALAYNCIAVDLMVRFALHGCSFILTATLMCEIALCR